MTRISVCSYPFSENNHIQPVYKFNGKAVNNLGKESKFFTIVSAIPDDFVQDEKYNLKIIPDPQ